jgi:hypothetical protein
MSAPIDHATLAPELVPELVRASVRTEILPHELPDVLDDYPLVQVLSLTVSTR